MFTSFCRRTLGLRPSKILSGLVLFTQLAAPVMSSWADAQEGVPPGTFVQKLEDVADKLKMTVNTSRRLVSKDRIADIQINNPEILSVTPLSPNEIQISAKKAGVTQLFLHDENKGVHSMDVMVLGDVQELTMILKLMFPKANLQVTPVANNAVVAGFVDDPAQVTLIMRVVQEYFPTAINAIQVGGVQQILLYVKVMEVSRTKLREMGVDWAEMTGSGDFIASGISGLLQMQGLPIGGGVASTGQETFSYGIIEPSNQFFGFLRMLQQRDLAKILAEPKLVTISGRPAYFNAGGEIPILVPQSLGTVSIQYRPYGTQVDFVPIVRDNGIIRLEVRPRVSELDEARSVIINNISVPALRVREIDTGVEMRAGQTLAIAGLVQTREAALHRGLPWVADIPYLGTAFRRTQSRSEEVELLIMVTPQLVAAVDPHCVTLSGPGMSTRQPNDVELYFKGSIEEPCRPVSPAGITGMPLDMGVGHGAGAPTTLTPTSEGVLPAPTMAPPGGYAPQGNSVPSAPAQPVPPPSTGSVPGNKPSVTPGTGSGASLTSPNFGQNRAPQQNRPNITPTTGVPRANADGAPGLIGPMGYDDLE